MEEPGVSLTHDFDGEQIKSVLLDDKIKYYAAKAGIGAASKCFKDGNKSYILP